MTATETETDRLTTLTYEHDGRRAVFRGVVDATNLEIFRDFLGLIAVGGDVEIAIGDLEIRTPEACSFLIERVRAGRRLVLTADAITSETAVVAKA